MTIEQIRNDDDLTAAFRRLEAIFQAEEKTPEADEREALVTLVEAYGNKYFDFDLAERLSMPSKVRS